MHFRSPRHPSGRLLEYGGTSRKGQRKIRRPFDGKKPLHLVFYSEKARGERSFLHRKHKNALLQLLRRLARRHSVKILEFENGGTHLHLVARFSQRKNLRAFLRVFSQGVMFEATGARKGNPFGRFFTTVTYSRVVEWGPPWQKLKICLGKAPWVAMGHGSISFDAWYRKAREAPS